MLFVDICLSAFYVLGMGGTFLRGNFKREFAKARGAASPTDVDEAVHSALFKVKKTFESLFRDERAKQNALSLFPELRDLTEEPTGQKVDVPKMKRILLDSALWPIMLPLNFSVNAAHNIVANEHKDKIAQAQALRTLAEHEDDPILKAAFATGDPEKVSEAVYKVSVASNKAAKESEELELGEGDDGALSESFPMPELLRKGKKNLN